VTDAMTRREFIVGSSALAGALCLGSSPVTAVPRAGNAQPEIVLFDPGHAEACRKIGEGVGGCRTLAISGDRVRFARQFFSGAAVPSHIAGLTSYSDYVLLSGCAAEHGYRVVAETARGPLVEWKVERRATS
jgi:hypothetical protein